MRKRIRRPGPQLERYHRDDWNQEQLAALLARTAVRVIRDFLGWPPGS